MVMVTSVMGVMAMRNIAPRGGIEPLSLVLRTSVITIIPLRLSDVTTPYPRLPIYYDSLPERSVQTTTLHPEVTII